MASAWRVLQIQLEVLRHVDIRRSQYGIVGRLVSGQCPCPHLFATEQELADDLALADHGDTLGRDRLDDGRELALDVDAGELGTNGHGSDSDRQGGRDMAGAGPDQDAAENLHAGWQVTDLHQDRGELDDETPDSLRTRLARLRRAVGDGLRGLSKGIVRVAPCAQLN